MENSFKPIKSAEAWQLSNPPVLSLAAIRGSLDTIAKAGGIKALREKSKKLTGYLRFLLETRLEEQIDIFTPSQQDKSGCQLSLAVKTQSGQSADRGRQVFETIEAAGVTGDWRYPNVIRVAPVPLYNSYQDVYRFVDILEKALTENRG